MSRDIRYSNQFHALLRHSVALVSDQGVRHKKKGLSMAVLVEAISVIVRRKAIDEKLIDGWNGFLTLVPNKTFCADEEIARVGFMSPHDVEGFVTRLEELGLTFAKDGKGIDIAVVDQQRGSTIECDWLEFAHIRINNSGDNIAACWLFEGQRLSVAGIHLPDNKIQLATPQDWTYEGSLSQKFIFVGNEAVNQKMIFLQHEDGKDVYLDFDTGKKLFIGRTNKNV